MKETSKNQLVWIVWADELAGPIYISGKLYYSFSCWTWLWLHTGRLFQSTSRLQSARQKKKDSYMF
jgi:hypothetical protein